MNMFDSLLEVSCSGYWQPLWRHPDKHWDLLGKRSKWNSWVAPKKFGKLTGSWKMAKASDNFQHTGMGVIRWNNFIDRNTYFIKIVQWLIYEHKMRKLWSRTMGDRECPCDNSHMHLCADKSSFVCGVVCLFFFFLFSVQDNTFNFTLLD